MLTRAFPLVLCLLPLARAYPQSPSPFSFQEVTRKVGLETDLRTSLNHAVAWGDYDGDGRLDLFLGNFADRLGQPHDGRNGLYRQTKQGTFERVSLPVVERFARCSGAVFADLDDDGDLDLYVSSNTLPHSRAKDNAGLAQKEPSRLFRNDGDGKFVDISETCGACPPDLFRTRDIGVLDYDGDGKLDLFLTQDPLLQRDKVPARSRLFRNLGGLKFRDVTAAVGLPDDLWALGVVVGDLNGDRRPDIFAAGSNRLFVSTPGGKFQEAVELRKVFEHIPTDRGEDIVSGAALGDIDNDGDLDLLTGPHFPKARIKVYLNEGIDRGVPRFRDATADLGIPVLPNKAPSMDVGDFDNDGLPDLYWSCWFADGEKRWPFLCRGLGKKNGLPRFEIPQTDHTKSDVRKNLPQPGSLGMVYYVDGPAVDFDADGRLDFFVGIWPVEGSRVFRNTTPAGHWLQVRVEGKKMNRQGIGAQVRLYESGKAGDPKALLGFREISLNVGYSSSRPAVAHFGLGKRKQCDVEVVFPTRDQPLVQRNVAVDRFLTIREP